jgi:hypothetical protein
MQWVLERLKGRVGVAVVLVLVVLAAITVGRLRGSSGSGSNRPAYDANQQTPVSINPSGNPSAADDGPAAVATSGAVTAPSLSPGTAAPLKVAGAFLTAWLNSKLTADQWHAGVSRYATPALSAKLSGVDPAGVPATRTTGEMTVSPRGDGAAAAIVKVDSGTVELRLIATEGQWLVDGVDWSRG